VVGVSFKRRGQLRGPKASLLGYGLVYYRARILDRCVSSCVQIDSSYRKCQIVCVCVNGVARNHEKRIPENNKYLQKFLTLSELQTQDVKIIAGKVDYPSWPWYDSLMIRLIMKMTDGPTDPTAIIDYTDWNDVKVYADHIAKLATVVPA